MKTVLLVEDDPQLARLFTMRLSRAGLVVTVAPSCLLARSSVGPFDVGLFDIILPDGDGVDVARELLAAGRVRRALFYSGTTDQRIWLRVREQGGRFVHKDEGVARIAEQVIALADEPYDAPG